MLEGLRRAEVEEQTYLRAHARHLARLRARLAPLRAQYFAEVARVHAVRRGRRRLLRRARVALRARSEAQASVRVHLLQLELGCEGRLFAVPLAPSDLEAAFVRAKAEADDAAPPRDDVDVEATSLQRSSQSTPASAHAPPAGGSGGGGGRRDDGGWRSAAHASRTVIDCHRLYIAPARFASGGEGGVSGGDDGSGWEAGVGEGAGGSGSAGGAESARWRWLCGSFAELGEALVAHADALGGGGGGGNAGAGDGEAWWRVQAGGGRGGGSDAAAAAAGPQLCWALNAVKSRALALPPLPWPGAREATAVGDGGGETNAGDESWEGQGELEDESEEEDGDDDADDKDEGKGVQLCAALLCRECRAWREPTEHATETAAADDAANAALKTEWVAEYLVLYELSFEDDAAVAAAGRLPSGEAAPRLPVAPTQP